MRAQRRLSGLVVVALLILGAMTAGHHHRLVAPAGAPAISAPESFDPIGRTTDCVVCRAADPARIVIAEIAAPRVLIVPLTFVSTTANALPAFYRPCSPRAPPSAA
ncbi:MAG: hypothetical protein M3P06_15160 [Acidobacteriota bacterium]|nr:hypothetical protein [Acidobacteriota bacterium]